MEDWTAGYVADIGYTYGYYPELNPVTARFAMVSAGLVPPGDAVACELGFGQGLSTNFHAAASRTQWWGTDFNPAQAAFARELAAAAGTGAQLFDESFEDFCSRSDVPEMDYIALHGIWSWVNDTNRSVIVEFIRRKLKPGGIVYISYNAHPGWASGVPMRDLLVQHAETMAVQGQGIVSRIDEALAFADKLMQAKPRFFGANPQVADRLKKLGTQDRHYLAHEFFNRDWEPMSFAKMASMLNGAKLTFGCSANLLEHVDNLVLSPEQVVLVKAIPDAVFRQTVRDFCINQQFRKDYWVRGSRPLSPSLQRDELDAQRVVLGTRADQVNLTLSVQPEVKLSEAVYRPLVQALSSQHPRPLGDIVRELRRDNLAPAKVLQAVVVLAGAGQLFPAQSEATVDAVKASTQRLNRHMMELARSTNSTPYLVSPVTGGGVTVNRFHQLFLRARLNGAARRADWVRQVWQELGVLGQRLTRDGKPLSTPEENIAELDRHAGEFEQRLPVLEGLQIA